MRAMPIKPLVTALLVIIALAAREAQSAAPPSLSPEAALELRARAFMVACLEARCDGAPVYAAAEVDPDLISAVRVVFTPEVVLLTLQQRDALLEPTGRYPGGGTLVDVQPLLRRSDEVISVGVWVERGRFEGLGRTILFERDGAEWALSSPEETGVTVTTSVP